MSELEELMKVFGEAGEDNSILVREDIAHFAASGNKILSTRAMQGLEIKAEETATGIAARVRVLEGTIIKNPIHLCFGILHKKGIQEIRMDIKLETGASARFIAHCVFPKAVVKVGKNGRYFTDFSKVKNQRVSLKQGSPLRIGRKRK
jgi:Fe-S cluster assembly scaffold protein SufB